MMILDPGSKVSHFSSVHSTIQQTCWQWANSVLGAARPANDTHLLVKVMIIPLLLELNSSSSDAIYCRPWLDTESDTAHLSNKLHDEQRMGSLYIWSLLDSPFSSWSLNLHVVIALNNLLWSDALSFLYQSLSITNTFSEQDAVVRSLSVRRGHGLLIHTHLYSTCFIHILWPTCAVPKTNSWPRQAQNISFRFSAWTANRHSAIRLVQLCEKTTFRTTFLPCPTSPMLTQRGSRIFLICRIFLDLLYYHVVIILLNFRHGMTFVLFIHVAIRICWTVSRLWRKLATKVDAKYVIQIFSPSSLIDWWCRASV